MAPKTNGRGVQVEDTRICVVMVGLPARGKSYIAQKGNYTPTSYLPELPTYLPTQHFLFQPYCLPKSCLVSPLTSVSCVIM